MRMSMSTTSGRCRRARSTAWSPSSASPTSSRSSACSIIARSPVRISGWSSAMPTRTVTPAPRTAAGPTTRKPPSGRGPACRSPPNIATRSRMPTRPCRPADGSAIGPPAGALVVDLDGDAVVGVAHDDRGLRPTGVLEHVRQRLLHDAVGREVDARRHLGRFALDAHVDVDAGAHHVGHQRVEVAQPGRRRERVGPVAVRSPQHAEQPPHLEQRRPGRGLDRRQRLPRRRRIGVGHHAPGPGVHGDDAHRVGDDVVQLAGDAQALLGDGPSARSACACASSAFRRSSSAV